MTDLIRSLVDRVEDAITALRGVVTLRWGTVIAVSPLSVRLDADDDPLPFPPVCPLLGMQVGDRVLCSVQNRRVTVISVTGMAKTEAASQEVVNAGTDTTRYVSPATMRSAAYRPFAEAAGVISTSTTYATVTYPVGRFTQRPILSPAVRSTVGNSVGLPWQEVGQANASSFKIIIFTIAGGVVGGEIEWSARQMTAASAQG